MIEPIHFDTELYPREALQQAAERYQCKARIELVDAGRDVVARLEPLEDADDAVALRHAFCTEAFAVTARTLRDLGPATPAAPCTTEPQWALLAPLTAGTRLGGWTLESLSPPRGDTAVLLLRHERQGIARVAIRRNTGTPLGIVHTNHLDFMLMNGGGGTTRTEASVEQVLSAIATLLRRRGTGDARTALALFAPDRAPATASVIPFISKRIAPRIDLETGVVAFDLDAAGVSRAALYDAVLAFADRCDVFLTRPEVNRVRVQLRPRRTASTDVLRLLARDVTNALNHTLRKTPGGAASGPRDRHTGLPRLARSRVDTDALLRDLEAADPTTVGLGFTGERGPGHENLRVLNIRGTGACNSECVFCIEKFNPGHRPMPKADATRQLILDSAGRFDMLFFANGEPTIHPKLFEYVELARGAGFTCFGMSSHFRTFSDPRFALKILEAGFEYFDIALHAADLDAQLDVNPIGDGGQSLHEALKGLAVLSRLADTLGIRISVTHKIVVSRLNVTQLEPIFRATYDRGVRHFILQPVRSIGLAPALQAKLAITEEEMLPHLNDLLQRTAGLGAVIKPYGFSRQDILSGEHVEAEQNRVKNIYGKARRSENHADGDPVTRADSSAQWPLLATAEHERPTDGRHWVEVRKAEAGRLTFATDGSRPILDAALQRGMDLMFGCRMGSCGMCCARLLEGRVDQSSQIFLNEEQVHAGFVLMCQARPLSDVVLQVCTDDEVDQL
jgi:2Fe-2S type ferredoxin